MEGRLTDGAIFNKSAKKTSIQGIFRTCGSRSDQN